MRSTIVLALCLFAVESSAQSLVVLNKREAAAVVFQPSTGEILRRIPVGDGPHEAATTPDGDWFVAANYGGSEPGSSLTLVRVAGSDSRTIDLTPYRRPHGVAFLPDGRLLVTAENDGKLLIVDLESGQVTDAIETGAELSHMVVASAAGDRAYVANIVSGSVTVVDLVRRERLAVIETGAGAEGIALSPDGRELWVTNREADTVSIVDTKQLEVVENLPCEIFPIRAAFTPDGRRVLVTCAVSSDVVVFDAATREIERRVHVGEGQPILAEERATADRQELASERSSVPIGVLVEPTGKTAYVASQDGGIVSVLDLSDWTIQARWRAGDGPDGMTWVPAVR